MKELFFTALSLPIALTQSIDDITSVFETMTNSIAENAPWELP